jgi:hypothetical protein
MTWVISFVKPQMAGEKSGRFSVWRHHAPIAAIQSAIISIQSSALAEYAISMTRAGAGVVLNRVMQHRLH